MNKTMMAVTTSTLMMTMMLSEEVCYRERTAGCPSLSRFIHHRPTFPPLLIFIMRWPFFSLQFISNWIGGIAQDCPTKPPQPPSYRVSACDIMLPVSLKCVSLKCRGTYASMHFNTLIFLKTQLVVFLIGKRSNFVFVFVYNNGTYWQGCLYNFVFAIVFVFVFMFVFVHPVVSSCST